MIRPSTPGLFFVFLLAAAQDASAQVSPVSITLTPSTSPNAGEPGVTNVSVTGSNFPTGTISAASITVSLTPAAGGTIVTASASSVATVIGSTRRVSFTIPASISVPTPTPYNVSIAGTTSSNTSFASSNTAALTINPLATLSSLTPNTGTTGQTLTVAVVGSFSNFLQGATLANFGAGITTNNVIVANATHASVNITIASAASPGARTVAMTTGAESAALANGFAVASSSPGSPTITSFTPAGGPSGTLVTVTGTNLLPGSGSTAQVTLAKQGGGTISTLASNATATSLAFVIPAGATTGPFSLTVNGGSVTSATPLTVAATSTFTLNAAPGTAIVLQGQSAAYAVSLTTSNGFNQLASLSLTGLPAGVTASLVPPQITAGQTSVLTVSAPSGQPTGPSSLNLSASATVAGIAVTQSAPLTLNVQGVTTSLVGRTVVSDALETPLAGVTIAMQGKDGNGNITGCIGSTVSDGAGNFLLKSLPATCLGPQLVGYDGTTATSPAGQYAGVNLAYTFVSGQVTPAPVLIHLPRIDTAETFYVQQNASADQSYSFKTIPNLSVTVYAGTTFTMSNGSQPNPFPLAAINVPVDRLPDIKPPVPTMITAFIVAFQPANATTNQPVAVYYPNPLNNAPTTDMTLLTLDPTHGAMVPYGTGAVSADGTQIVPDLDPAHSGHRYGLVHFDWHMPGYQSTNQKNPWPQCPKCGSGEPVDASSGLEVIRETDISFGGARGGISFVRTYRNGINPAATIFGPFGYGTNHNFSYELAVVSPSSASVIPLIMPDGNQFPFSRQANNTYVNTSGIPSMAGAVMTVAPPNTNLRWKDGTIYQFTPLSVPPVIRNLLTSITDPNGNVTQIVYNGFEISDIVDPVGRALHFNWNVEGCITQVTAPDGSFVSYNYDGGYAGSFCTLANAVNNVAVLRVVTHPDGTTTRYDYDPQDNLTAVTDGRGIVIASNTYDANYRVTQQKQANGGLLQFSYTLQNPTAPATSPVLSTTVTDALGNQSTYRFSTAQALLSATDSLGRERVFTRDGNNNIVSITGAADCAFCGDSTTGDQSFTYDSNDNLLSETDALSNTTKFTYDPTFNKVTSIQDPLGNTTTFAYDSHGNLLNRSDPNGNTTKYQYDQYGELTQVTDPTNQTTYFVHDSFGNLVSIKDPLGDVTSLQYDVNGRLIQSQDALGRKTQIAYDKANRIISQTNAQNNATTFGYDQVGNLLTVTDARNRQTSFTYDTMNGLLTRTDPLGRTDTRTYDLNENLTQFQDRRGQTSTFNFDAANRLVGETYQDGSTVSRSYDANDRLLSAMDSMSGSFGFTYDLAGRLTGSQTPFGALQYTRDGLGRATARQVVGQSPVTYTYDKAGNLLTASTPTVGITRTYDPRNLLASAVRTDAVTSQYGYDPLGRLLTLTHTGPSGLLSSLSYSYDTVGNRIGAVNNMAQSLTTGAVPSANYDTDNEQTQFGSTTNSFDSDGDLRASASAVGPTAYTWDARGRLSSMTEPTGQTTSFLYDFVGNLIQQTDAGPVANVTQTFVLDDLTNVAYASRSDGDQYSVLAGQAIDDHIAVAHVNGLIEYGLTDVVNSTIATVDQTGAVKGHFLYEPFGQTNAFNSAYPFQYTGRIPISNAVYYYRARFYNSQTGRFISEDPIGFGSYKYARNSPVKLIDPLGLKGCDPSAGAANFNACNLLVSLANAEDKYAEPARRLLDAGLLVGSFFAGEGPLGVGLAISGLTTDLAQGKTASSVCDVASFAAGGVPGNILATACYLSDNADWLSAWLVERLTKNANLNLQFCLNPQPF